MFVITVDSMVQGEWQHHQTIDFTDEEPFSMIKEFNGQALDLLTAVEDGESPFQAVRVALEWRHG
jgi:hypothetical protein